ncbi:hypothetical protein C8R43DRAFT_595873 [Mycena crocata]|nr:hypothetical protein C8R43DRAFT_595873 [Mycena crocata]
MSLSLSIEELLALHVEAQMDGSIDLCIRSSPKFNAAPLSASYQEPEWLVHSEQAKLHLRANFGRESERLPETSPGWLLPASDEEGVIDQTHLSNDNASTQFVEDIQSVAYGYPDTSMDWEDYMIHNASHSSSSTDQPLHINDDLRSPDVYSSAPAVTALPTSHIGRSDNHHPPFNATYVSNDLTTVPGDSSSSASTSPSPSPCITTRDSSLSPTCYSDDLDSPASSMSNWSSASPYPVPNTSPTSDTSGERSKPATCRLPCSNADCNRIFKNEYTRGLHMKAHLSTFRRYPCSRCSLVLSRQHDRMRHEASKHGILPKFECSGCRKTFGTQKNMMKHTCQETGGIRWHSGL